MSIKIVRLLSGEELMGEYSEDNETAEVLIKNVCQIATSFTDAEYKNASIGLMPYLPYADLEDGIRIKKTYVGFKVDPIQDMMNEYNRIFGSGIVVPSTKQVIAP